MSKPPPNSSSSSASRWGHVFALDLRSLAVFRVALALLILIDLVRRFPLIETFYTDAGVLPRSLIFLSAVHPLSLNLLSGSHGFQALLFALGACSALSLAIGYQTRLATIASWVLLTSLHVRNLHLVIGADEWLRVLLLWSMLLPLGARWSLDARRAPTQTLSPLLLSAATVAMVFQFAYVYFCSGWCKNGPEWHSTHTAIQLALGQGDWVRPLGQFLSQYPGLLKFLTPTVVYYEIAVAVLLLLPFLQHRLRTMVIVSLWFFQLSMGLTLHVQLFPFVSSAATLPLIPSSCWDWLAKRVPWIATRPLAGGSSPRRSPRPPAGKVWALRLQEAVAIFLIGWVTAAAFSYYAQLDAPGWRRLRSVGYVLGLAATWDMYFQPSSRSSSFEAMATLRDNTVVDLLQAGDSEPELKRATQSRAGKLYLVELSKPHAMEAEQRQYILWLCRTWNQGKPAERQVGNIKFFHVKKDILSSTPPRRDIVQEANFPRP